MYFAPVSSSLRSRFSSAPSARAPDQSVERFLQQAFATPFGSSQPLDKSLSQDDQSYQLVLDLPGVSREQLSIQIEANQVQIETRPQAPRAYRFAYDLPQDIDAATSEAKLENGVLTLKLGKQTPKSNAVSLAVN